jgi:preprotein translocase subunit SecY
MKGGRKQGFRTFKSQLKGLPTACKAAVILAVIILVRFGSSYPLPFVDGDYMRMILGIQGLAFLNSITGGSMQQMSFFALSISPYITASIIMQLMTVVFPSLEEMQKDGKTGRERFKHITQAVAVTLSVIQSVAMAVGLGARGLLVSYTPATVAAASVIWSIGAIVLIGISSFLDWMEVGSGISILLCANILSTFPSDVFALRDMFVSGKIPAVAVLNACLIIATFLAILGVCVVLASTSREVPVVNSRKLAGTLDKSSFPIPLNTCSVMPVIFASSILSLPIIVSQFTGTAKDGIPMHIMRCLTTGEWFKPEQPLYTVGAFLYFGLTTLFTYFYLDIGFNPYEIADNLKRSGATIPGIRPGAPTVEYIRKTSTRIALAGNTATTLLILAMHAVCNAYGLGALSIAGTSVIILVGVVIEERRLLASLAAVKQFSGRRKKRRGIL